MADCSGLARHWAAGTVDGRETGLAWRRARPRPSASPSGAAADRRGLRGGRHRSSGLESTTSPTLATLQSTRTGIEATATRQRHRIDDVVIRVSSAVRQHGVAATRCATATSQRLQAVERITPDSRKPISTKQRGESLPAACGRHAFADAMSQTELAISHETDSALPQATTLARMKRCNDCVSSRVRIRSPRRSITIATARNRRGSISATSRTDATQHSPAYVTALVIRRTKTDGRLQYRRNHAAAAA